MTSSLARKGGITYNHVTNQTDMQEATFQGQKGRGFLSATQMMDNKRVMRRFLILQITAPDTWKILLTMFFIKTPDINLRFIFNTEVQQKYFSQFANQSASQNGMYVQGCARYHYFDKMPKALF